MDPAVQQQLIQQALACRQQAYAPYSNFPVGSSLMTEDGTIFTGTNVENASYGLTICAERVAACSAAAAGHRKIVAVAVATAGGHGPCGACRQFLAEFADGMEIVLVDSDDPQSITKTTLDELLPGQFKLKE